MAVEIPFRREFSFEYGRLEPVAPIMRRIVARNPSRFTFRATGTYVVGHGQIAVIDDHLNRGRKMDTRTPASQCRFVA